MARRQVGAKPSTDYDYLPPGTTITVLEISSVYAVRPTARTDVFVIWKGPDAPTVGGSYSITGVDMWFQTT